MHTGTTQGLHYEIHDGPADAETVILSAGFGGMGAMWEPQMAALTARFRVLRYDQRGTGRSTPVLTAPHSVEAMGRDILAVMDATDTLQAHLVGQAAGGMAALALALDRPERLERLVVVSGWSHADPHLTRVLAARTRLLEAFGPAAWVEAAPLFHYPPDWISRNDARLRAGAARDIIALPPTEVILARLDALMRFDIDERLDEIDLPILVCAAADDALVPPRCSRWLATALPNATLDVTPWGGHAFPELAADAFNATLVWKKENPFREFGGSSLLFLKKKKCEETVL